MQRSSEATDVARFPRLLLISVLSLLALSSGRQYIESALTPASISSRTPDCHECSVVCAGFTRLHRL